MPYLEIATERFDLQQVNDTGKFMENGCAIGDFIKWDEAEQIAINTAN